MKRTIPLLISALGGFALIFAFFVPGEIAKSLPAMEEWGEYVSVWFDILASIAFILGGGNLLKVHLKKISDQVPGWGYSAVILIAFVATLVIGLWKFGTSPAANAEHYGESFAKLPLDEMPEFTIDIDPKFLDADGNIALRADEERLPVSVHGQLSSKRTSETEGTITFRGWMQPGQKSDLLGYRETLEWQCMVERLSETAVPSLPTGSASVEVGIDGSEFLGAEFQNDEVTVDTLVAEKADAVGAIKGRVRYYADHETLSFTGYMSDEDETGLRLALGASPTVSEAIDQLKGLSRQQTVVTGVRLPEGFEVPKDFQKQLKVVTKGDQTTLTLLGPMPPALQEVIKSEWMPIKRVRPFGADELAIFRSEIESRGITFNSDQREAFDKQVATIWGPEVLIAAINAAGSAPERTFTACELLEQQKSGVAELKEKETIGENVTLNELQQETIRKFTADGPIKSEEIELLSQELNEIAPLANGQIGEVAGFIDEQPSMAQFKRDLAFNLLKAGKESGHQLTQDQIDFLLADYREREAFERKIDELFVASHVEKFPWSGEYAGQGSPFWWIYEYVFQPLTATMFALLAFYVASAAFRAFRAKNVEAILLLSTAFVILLGRTYLGSPLGADVVTVYIMKVFNTAGSRAIMIGIALGIASTSLKVLLGVDRSYLGSGDD